MDNQTLIEFVETPHWGVSFVMHYQSSDVWYCIIIRMTYNKIMSITEGLDDTPYEAAAAGIDDSESFMNFGDFFHELNEEKIALGRVCEAILSDDIFVEELSSHSADNGEGLLSVIMRKLDSEGIDVDKGRPWAYVCERLYRQRVLKLGHLKALGLGHLANGSWRDE